MIVILKYPAVLVLALSQSNNNWTSRPRLVKLPRAKRCTRRPTKLPFYYRWLHYAFWPFKVVQGYRLLQKWKTNIFSFLLVINRDLGSIMHHLSPNQGDRLRMSLSILPGKKSGHLSTVQWKPHNPICSRFVTLHSCHRRRQTTDRRRTMTITELCNSFSMFR